MDENCSHDCSTCGSDCASREQPQSLLAPMNPNSDVKNVIAVVSGKGGVGKSLVTALMACNMQRRGHKTAVLDADVTGPSIPRIFGLEGARALGTEEGKDAQTLPWVNSVAALASFFGGLSASQRHLVVTYSRSPPLPPRPWQAGLCFLCVPKNGRLVGAWGTFDG